MATISIEYRFGFRGQREDMVFTVELDRETGIALSPAESRAEEWTALEYCQCSFCQFRPQDQAHCPVAWNISGVAARFRDIFSIEESDISVTTHERQYCRRDKVSQGLRSILGLYLAASGCPQMDILRPMARFHLPFASMEETIQRHVSNFLLYEYFRQGQGAEISLAGLVERMKPIDEVNRSICSRLEHFVHADSNRNALTVLNLFGAMIAFEVHGNLDKLRELYCGRDFFNADLKQYILPSAKRISDS
jgi:hypothetical protein